MPTGFVRGCTDLTLVIASLDLSSEPLVGAQCHHVPPRSPCQVEHVTHAARPAHGSTIKSQPPTNGASSPASIHLFQRSANSNRRFAQPPQRRQHAQWPRPRIATNSSLGARLGGIHTSTIAIAIAGPNRPQAGLASSYCHTHRISTSSCTPATTPARACTKDHVLQEARACRAHRLGSQSPGL